MHIEKLLCGLASNSSMATVRQARRKQFSVGPAGQGHSHQISRLGCRRRVIRREARPLGGSGGMPPQEKFGFQAFWSEVVSGAILERNRNTWTTKLPSFLPHSAYKGQNAASVSTSSCNHLNASHHSARKLISSPIEPNCRFENLNAFVGRNCAVISRLRAWPRSQPTLAGNEAIFHAAPFFFFAEPNIGPATAGPAGPTPTALLDKRYTYANETHTKMNLEGKDKLMFVGDTCRASTVYLYAHGQSPLHQLWTGWAYNTYWSERIIIRVYHIYKPIQELRAEGVGL